MFRLLKMFLSWFPLNTKRSLFTWTEGYTWNLKTVKVISYKLRFNNSSDDFITIKNCPYCGGALFTNDDVFSSISEDTIKKYIESQKVMTNYTYKFRIYPDKEQCAKLKKFAGCVRFVYNYLLALSKESKNWNTYEYKMLLPGLKKQYPFLKEAPSYPYSRRFSILERLMITFSKRGQDSLHLRRKMAIPSTSHMKG